MTAYSVQANELFEVSPLKVMLPGAATGKMMLFLIVIVRLLGPASVLTTAVVSGRLPVHWNTLFGYLTVCNLCCQDGARHASFERRVHQEEAVGDVAAELVFAAAVIVQDEIPIERRPRLGSAPAVGGLAKQLSVIVRPRGVQKPGVESKKQCSTTRNPVVTGADGLAVTDMANGPTELVQVELVRANSTTRAG